MQADFDCVGVVGDEQAGIGDVGVDGAVEMHAVGEVVANAELQVFGEFALDCEVGLLGVAVFEIALNRDGEREKRKRIARIHASRRSGGREAEEILTDEKRVGLEGIEALLSGLVAHRGKSYRAAGEIAS